MDPSFWTRDKKSSMERHNPQSAWEERLRKVSNSGQSQNHRLPGLWRSDYCDYAVKRANINFRCLLQAAERTREAFHTNLVSQDFFMLSGTSGLLCGTHTLLFSGYRCSFAGGKTSGKWRWTLHQSRRWDWVELLTHSSRTLRCAQEPRYFTLLLFTKSKTLNINIHIKYQSKHNIYILYLLTQGYMFRLLRIIIRPSEEPVQDHRSYCALWDPKRLQR
jgi:hypothetical protein